MNDPRPSWLDDNHLRILVIMDITLLEIPSNQYWLELNLLSLTLRNCALVWNL